MKINMKEDDDIIKQIEIKKLLKEHKNLLKVIEIIKKETFIEDIGNGIKTEAVVILRDNLTPNELDIYEQKLVFERLEKEGLMVGDWQEINSSDTSETNVESMEIYYGHLYSKKLDKFSKEIKGEYDALLKAVEKKTKKQKLKRITPKLIYNPPQIIWGNIEIPLPPDSKQIDVCKSLFKREKGKTVCWDEISEKVDDLHIKSPKKEWRIIYDAVRKVNEKVERKTGLKLFYVKGKTFYRKY